MIEKDAIEILKSIQDGLEETRFLERCAIDMAIEALKTETKKCPNCGSDLYEYCFSCCYEGKKVKDFGECKTCKHFVKGGLDGKTYVCEHPDIEQDDYFNYAFLMMEENDFCSRYEPREKEGDGNES